MTLSTNVLISREQRGARTAAPESRSDWSDPFKQLALYVVQTKEYRRNLAFWRFAITISADRPSSPPLPRRSRLIVPDRATSSTTNDPKRARSYNGRRRPSSSTSVHQVASRRQSVTETATPVYPCLQQPFQRPQSTIVSRQDQRHTSTGKIPRSGSSYD